MEPLTRLTRHAGHRNFGVQLEVMELTQGRCNDSCVLLVRVGFIVCLIHNTRNTRRFSRIFASPHYRPLAKLKRRAGMAHAQVYLLAKHQTRRNQETTDSIALCTLHASPSIISRPTPVGIRSIPPQHQSIPIRFHPLSQVHYFLKE